MRNKGDGAEEKRLVSKQIVSVVGDCDASFARFCSISYQVRSQWLTVVCETKWDETKWNETKWDETKWKSVVCEMEICSLRNENLYFAK